MRRPLLVFALFFAACGGPAAAPPGSVAPVGATSVMPTSAASAAPVASAAAPPPEPCMVVVSGRAPGAPVTEVGTVTMHVQKDSCTIEARATDGTTRPMPPCDLKKARDLASEGACALGGDIAWLAKDESGGVAELKVGRYSNPDPKADLALICSPFASLKNPATGKTIDAAGIDDSQKARIRADVMTNTLTSRQWRLWMYHFLSDRQASIATLRDAARAAHLTCDIEWTATK